MSDFLQVIARYGPVRAILGLKSADFRHINEFAQHFDPTAVLTK